MIMRLLMIAAALMAASGCATVQPYERSLLMSRAMQEPLDPLEASFDAHVYGTRESMTGASPVGGASCGCM